ncbi:Crinkler (CRN), partial [Phytophthora megakarya]
MWKYTREIGFPVLKYKYYVVSNGAKTSFQYVEVVQHYVFKAFNAANNVIIKFAKQYGKEFRICSRIPVLRMFDKWLGIRRNGTTSIITPSLGPCQLLKIKKVLKDASFVHGDLRENNVMWDSFKNRVVLIDFDWAGKDGVDTYPPFMNDEIAWPKGAEYGKPLRVA